MNPNEHDEEWYTEENAAYWGEDFDEESFWEGEEYSDEDLLACGVMRDGHCSFAGSEYCDWSCPVARKS